MSKLSDKISCEKTIEIIENQQKEHFEKHFRSAILSTSMTMEEWIKDCNEKKLREEKDRRGNTHNTPDTEN